MIAVMKENEQVTTTAEPRWKAAGPPYLLTRDELLSELHKLGYQMSDRQIRDWVTDKIIPRPTHRLPPGATDGIARALYPAWLLVVITKLLQEIDRGASRAEAQHLAQPLIEQWREHADNLYIIDQVLAGNRVLWGSATAQPATGSGPGVTTPQTGDTERRDAVAHVNTQVLLTGQSSVTAKGTVLPRIPRRLQLAIWGYAARFTERNSTRVTEASLTLRTEDGGEVHITINPAPPPKKRRA